MQKQSKIIIYKTDNEKISVDILVENKNFWITQEQMAILFAKSVSTISEHINNIYKEEELIKELTLQKSGNTGFQQKGTNYYNLKLVFAVGYRVKSKEGINFRKWASERLEEYLVNWFSLNEEKLKSGKTTQYFDRLQNKLREIRLSEKIFYQKIKEIYTTSIDYDPKDDKTILFFKTVQNKLLWAISQKTAAELVYNRVDISKPLLWMQSFNKEWENNITKKDISVAKNYLDEKEMKTLWLLVEQFLAFAESMADSEIIMKMNDWIERLDLILKMNGKEILENYWKISHKLALEKSEIIYNEFKDNKKVLEKKESLKQLESDLKTFK